MKKVTDLTPVSTQLADNTNIRKESTVCNSTTVTITNEKMQVVSVGGANSEKSPHTAACKTDLTGERKRAEQNGGAPNKQLPISALNKDSVYMRDRQRVETIIKNMQREGAETLQVISDFDMTLTRFDHNGTLCPTTYSILHRSDLVSEECKAEMSKLLAYYYPIEIDSSMSVEDKIPYMVEWWTKVHDLLIKQKIRKEHLAQAVRDSGSMLREGYKSFFDMLLQNSVPVLIFSAGVGDILEEVITEHNVFHSNIRIFSNYMDYDQHGVAYAFKGETIHTFNKREGALQNTHFVHDCTNVLLLGDSLGDLNMADGVQDLHNILRIGYLNDKVEERREKYINSYDIVLEKDETMDVPNAILQYICDVKK